MMETMRFYLCMLRERDYRDEILCVLYFEEVVCLCLSACVLIGCEESLFLYIAHSPYLFLFFVSNYNNNNIDILIVCFHELNQL